MKRGDFSYKTGHTQSHASLGRLRNQNQESRAESITRDMMYSKPNVKYYSNNEGNKTLHKKTIPHKSEEELKQKIKQLEYELKKKITEDCYLVKLFKTKNSAQVSHIDIYLEMRELQQALDEKDKTIEELNKILDKAQSKLLETQEKAEEAAREIQDLLTAKDQQEIMHTNEIQAFSFQVDEYKKKCEHQLSQKQNHILQERKMKEEKDILLKEIKRHYEEAVQHNAQLEEKLKIEKLKFKELEEKLNEKNLESKKILQSKISQLQDQLEKSLLREQEKSAVNDELQKKCEHLEVLQIKAKKAAEQKEDQILEKNIQLKKYQQLCQSLEQRISDQEQTIAVKNTKNQSSIEHRKKKIQKLEAQIVQKDRQLTQLLEQKTKYNKELAMMEEKALEMQSKIKILTFQKEQNEVSLNKVTQKMDKESQNANRLIQQLQNKLFTAEKRASNALERLKEQQKEVKMNKQRNESVSTKQIEIYKAIGRLTQLSHHLKSIHQAETLKNKKFSSKQLSERGPENITECVDILAEELDTFFKQEYYPLLEHRKQMKQLYEETLCSMKDLLHSYNNFVEDQQLKGLSREFIEVVESVESCSRKERNTYLHLVIERLISMTAIKSYTSENGHQRTNANRQAKHQVYSKGYENDSLQNTMERQIDEEPEYEIKPYGVGRMERQNSSKVLNRNRYDRETRLSRSKLNNAKIYTEPDESFKHPVRKLQFEKENIMNRINRKETKNHLEAIKQYSSNHSSRGDDQLMFFKDRKALETDQGLKGKLNRAGSINNTFKGSKGDQNGGLSELQKKYYR